MTQQVAAKFEYCNPTTVRLIAFGRNDIGQTHVINIMETDRGNERVLLDLLQDDVDLLSVHVITEDREWVMPDSLTLLEALEATAVTTYE